MQRALVHLVYGATGAGKSTYAEALAQDLRAVRFSIYEWMERLHNPDKPEVNQADTFQFEVTRAMFDFIESIWQPPTDKELARMPHNIIRDY